MIEGNPIVVYGFGAVLVLLLLRLVYSLASMTVRITGYALVLVSAAGFFEPGLLHLVLTSVPLPADVLADLEEMLKGDLFWKHSEAWVTFGFHIVLGFIGVLSVYKAMEWWYPGAFAVGLAWLVGVVQLDGYLLANVLDWHWTKGLYTEVVMAGAAGFAVGLVFAVLFLEPSIQTRSSKKSAEMKEYL